MENSSTREFYALRHATSGKLMRLESNTYGAFSYSLSSFEGFPVFEAPTERDLLRVLRDNTPNYNSSERMPGWGGFKREELLPVLVSATTEFTPVAMPEHQSVFKTVELRQVPLVVAQKYAGDKALPSDTPVYFWLVLLPENLSLAQAALSWTGQNVGTPCESFSRTVYAVCPVPSDYADQLEGRTGALLLASDLEY